MMMALRLQHLGSAVPHLWSLLRLIQVPLQLMMLAISALPLVLLLELSLLPFVQDRWSALAVVLQELCR
jgi:hypothetical protein